MMFGSRPKAYTAPGNLPADFSAELLSAVPIGGGSMYETPGIGDGLKAPMPQAKAQQDGGLPLWKLALGGLFDSIQNQTGGQGMFIPNLLQQQQLARQQQARQQAREEDFTDWRRQYDYQIANQKDPTPNEFDRRLAAAGILPGSTEYIRLNREKAENDANPPRWVTFPDGSMRQMGGSTPMAPVGRLTPIGGN